MSRTMTRSFLNAAVPHEPAIGPMHSPSISLQYSIGQVRRGAMAEGDAVVVEQEHGAAHARRDALDQRDERVERLAEHARDVASESSAAGSSPSSAKKLPVARRGRGAVGVRDDVLSGEGERRDAGEPRGIGRGAESGLEL